MFSIAEAPVAATLVVRLDSIITAELLLGWATGPREDWPIIAPCIMATIITRARGVKRVHGENIGSQDNVIMIMMQDAH